MTPSISSDDVIERAVVDYLRKSLADRYSLQTIRRYRGFSGLSDEHIQSIREFGLRYIYPEWETRCFQNKVFEKLMALLASPLRLSPLTATALKSFLRFGRDLPKAVEAGKKVINAFETTRSLEYRIVQEIKDRNLIKKNSLCREISITVALAAIGREEFETFVGNLVALMNLLAQRRLLETGAAVLHAIAVAMDKRPDLYDETERKGVHYAVEIMNHGLAIFDRLDERAVKEAIQAIPQVEHEWFERVLQQGHTRC